MVGIRLLILERTRIESAVHLRQILMARANAQIDYVGSGKNFDVGYLDLKRGKLRDAGAHRFNSRLRRTGKRARRQNGHMGVRSAAGNQFPSQMIQEFTQRIREIGDQGVVVHPILPARAPAILISYPRF